MGLPPPTHQEQCELLSVLCHVREPEPKEHSAFLNFYKTKVCLERELGIALTIAPSALGSHQHIWEASASTRCEISLPKTKAEIQRKLYSNVAEAERHRCMRIIVQLSFLVDCGSLDDYSSSFKRLNDDTFPTKWLDDHQFPAFFRQTFPINTSLQVSKVGKSLKAWKLHSRYKIKIVPTNDLAQHLVYNKRAGTLSVFHQMAYLKAHIGHSSTLPLSAPIEESLTRGTLPPQLLLETLYTIHYILFPLHDKKSSRLLRRLVKGDKNRPEEVFDPNATLFDGPIRPPSDLDGFELVYWAERLRSLQEIVGNPLPQHRMTHWMFSWFERHTSERNALIIALAGLFLAALFGFLGFLVGLAQLIVSYYSWKQQVPS